LSIDAPLAPDGQVIRVMVVDDFALVRRAIRDSLQARGFDVCADVELGADALTATLEHRPHVVLMDQRLPDLAGPAATRLILAQAPLTRVVAVSASLQAEDLHEAFAAGSAGYLLKTATPAEIAAAVCAAAAGETPVSPAVATHLVARFLATMTPAQPVPPVALAERLSDREREILTLVAAGHDNRAISEVLFISPHTVKGHVSTILSTLEVSNRIQAAVYAARYGLG
jgi:DNA-binding NarL/FixJ family response regulator